MKENSELEIRLDKNGEPESYDPVTGKTIGHISTMGNMIDETPEDRRRRKEGIKHVMKKLHIK